MSDAHVDEVELLRNDMLTVECFFERELRQPVAAVALYTARALC